MRVLCLKYYGWTGREYDAETGWYYFRARYFDPAVRRFVQEDPMGYGGGVNVYAFGEGGPLEGRDPSGLEWDRQLYQNAAEDYAFLAAKTSTLLEHEIDVYVNGAYAGRGNAWAALAFDMMGIQARLDEYERRQALLLQEADELAQDASDADLTRPEVGDIAGGGASDQEQGLQIYIGGVFLSESGNWENPVSRDGITFQEHILATDRGNNLWRHDRMLPGSFDLQLAFSDASQAVYYGWVVVQGYPTLLVSGVVYKDTNTGVFERSSFDPSP